VQQGASDENAAGAAARLAFFDASNKRIAHLYDDGNVIKSGSDSDWQLSSGDITAPPESAFVAPGASAYRDRQNAPLWVDNLRWNMEQAAQGTDTAGDIPLSLRVTDSAGRTADWSGSISVGPPATAAVLDFNNDMVTDSTGRVWTLQTQDASDVLGGQPVTIPFLDGSLSKEGSALSLLPDSHNLTQYDADYRGWSGGGINPGVWGNVGSGAPGKTNDFCVELFVRPNFHYLKESIGYGFLSLAGMQLAARFKTAITFENGTFTGATLLNSTATLLTPGEYFHCALTREGDIVSVWYNGARIRRYSGGSGWDVSATSQLYLGNANGNLDSYLAWEGQIDDVRLTFGWARYTAPFAPPSVPYRLGA
jgi:hypothetical protein